MYERALRGYEKALGLEPVNSYTLALNTIENLAGLYDTLRRLAQARVLYERYGIGIRSVFGVHHDRCQQIMQQSVSLEEI